MGTIATWMNPLMCPEIARMGPLDLPPKSDQLLDYLFAPQVERTAQAFTARYRALAADGDPLSIVPAEPNILEKLVWPLRSAQGSYALGNYLSCIAMCGLVGEMVTILTWDVSQLEFQRRALDDALAKQLLGSSFERLGQERRIDVLVAAGLIDDNTRRALDDLRVIRRKYLHLLSHSHAQVDADARKAFVAAVTVVRILLGVSGMNEDVVLRPDLARYLV